jgi:hypothetical protein
MRTIKQHLAKAAAYFDEVIAPHTLERAAATVNTHGDPTEEEYAAFMQQQVQWLQADRARLLKDLRSFLKRDGEPLQ